MTEMRPRFQTNTTRNGESVMSINRATPIDDLELYEYLTQLGFYGNQVSKWQLIVARHFRDTVGSPLVNDIVTLPDDECLSIYNYGVKSHQITEHLRNLPELPVVEEPAWPASINDLASLMKQFVVTVELLQEIASQVRNVL